MAGTGINDIRQGESILNPVIVTAATSRELAVLISALNGRERLQFCSREACRGELAGWPVILGVTGIGKVNAAAAIATASPTRTNPVASRGLILDSHRYW
jgi:hypothetical protein